MESTDSQGTVFVFRVPKFNVSIEYNPIIPFHYSIPILTNKAIEAPVSPPTIAATLPPTPALPATTVTKKNAQNDDDSLSGGAIAGVVIGTLLVMCCCCALIGAYALRKQSDGDGVPLAEDEKNNMTLDEEDFDNELACAKGEESSDDEDDDDDDEADESEDESDKEESDSDNDRMT